MNQGKSPSTSRASIKPSSLIFRALLQAVLLPWILSLFLFLPAGTLNWPIGWALLVAYVAGIFGTALLNIWHAPELAQERLAPQGPAERWDPLLTSAAKIFSLVIMLPVSGLDHRYDWSPHLAEWIPLTSLLLFLLAYLLIGWAMAANRFFSAVARIQAERGHRAVTGGPYRIIRHPGYAAMIIQFLAAPVALGSLWALILGVLAAGVYVIRTWLEDETLLRDLPGYQEYAC